VAIQREEFRRLGVLGDWENPYKTIDPAYEAIEIAELGRLVARGLLYRQKKPVYWCPSCVTALAEAEVEYEEHTSPSIYVKFRVRDSKGLFPLQPAGTFLVIWTTTPWTLPANVAIAVHPAFRYRLVGTPRGQLLLAEEMIADLMKLFGFAEGECELASGPLLGTSLEGVVCSHPWLDRDVVVLPAEFVAAGQGSGCVHIAPGHGREDYELGQRYGLPVLAPVDGEGRFTAEAGDLKGLGVFAGDRKIIERLRASDALLKEERLEHSYPHCWRCKSPVIFRATEQWFISMERTGLRKRALEAIEEVSWIPPWGRERIRGMLESRPDWCISRQRWWGVPIPVLYCAGCKEALVTEELCRRVAALFAQEGSDAWYRRSAAELAPAGLACPRCGCASFEKEEDILDVWFDSGVSHAAVVETHPQLGGTADLYLEGSDQHRGWFHTALLTAIGTRGRPPYRTVLTHGFTLDGAGRKMSKSLGNVIAPQDIIERYGAEILRLWVSAEDYREDLRISEEILKRLVEAYRKLRNTARFLVSNLYDFEPERHGLAPADLQELDRWILHRTQQLIRRCRDAYDRFEFHVVYHALTNFCSVDLSALYLDIVKDRLYCEAATSPERRSAQTALFRVLESLVRLMAPILSFTAEEIWQHVPKRKGAPASVLLSEMPEPDPELLDPALGYFWDRLFKERGEVLKALEEARKASIIGHSLDARVSLVCDGGEREALLPALLRRNKKVVEDVLIVSQAELADGRASAHLEPLVAARARGERGTHTVVPHPERSGERVCSYDSPSLDCYITVSRAEGAKCERCWKYQKDTGCDPAHPTLCGRCARVLRAGGEP
jgi:isoleucyl-tRNA synthetase